MPEDSTNDRRLLDERDQAQAAATPRTRLKGIVEIIARRFDTREFQMLVWPDGAAGQQLRRSNGLPGTGATR